MSAGAHLIKTSSKPVWTPSASCGSPGTGRPAQSDARKDRGEQMKKCIALLALVAASGMALAQTGNAQQQQPAGQTAQQGQQTPAQGQPAQGQAAPAPAGK